MATGTERTDPKRVLGLVALIVLMLAIIGAFRQPDAAFLSKHGDIGTIDFIQYWSAHKLLIRGANPYDPALLYAVEVAQGLPDAEPIMMWNPPWLVTMLAPVVSFDFITSARLWFGLNLVFAAVAGLLTVFAFTGRLRPSPAALFAAFAFAPHLSTLRFGQLGLMFAVCMAGLLVADRRKDDWMAGLALVPLTVKPHLIYLVLMLLAYWIITQRRFKVVLSFGMGFGLLLLATYVQYPEALAQWIGAFGEPPTHWIVGTLVGIFREVLFRITGEVQHWPMSVIPALSALAFAGWLVLRRPKVELLHLLPPVLALSLFSAPYGWMFDQSQLILIQVGLVSLAEEVDQRLRKQVWLGLFVIQGAVVLQKMTPFEGHQYYFWTSLVMFAVWQVFFPKLQAAAAGPATSDSL